MSLIDIEADLGLIDIDLELSLIDIDLALGLPLVTGTSGADRTAGSTGANVIATLGDNDRIIGSDGIDLIDGGSGVDHLIFDFANTVRHANGGAARVVTITDSSVRTGESGLLGPDVQTSMTGIEGIVLRFGAYVGGVVVDTNNDTADASAFTGSGGVQFVSGGGTDSFTGSSSSDVFCFLLGAGTNTQGSAIGGAGTDAVMVRIDLSGMNSVTFGASSILTAGGEAVTFSGVEQVAFLASGLVSGGTGGATTLDASGASSALTADFTNGGAVRDFAADITVQGSVFNDMIVTNAGNDTLNGGLGADMMAGGLGNDTYYVDDAGDLVVEYPDEGTDTVWSTISYTLTANVEILRLDGGLIDGTGNAGNNTIYGTDLANVLAGNAGSDVLYAGAGADQLYGGRGADTLFGGGGNDFMVGGKFDDVLHGGGGLDKLVGALGADRFVYESLADAGGSQTNSDIITDFDRSEGDLIDLSAIDADMATAGHQAFTFIGDAAFSGTAGELRYFHGVTRTIVEMDADGDGNADAFLRLAGLFDLQASDFVLDAAPGGSVFVKGEADMLGGSDAVVFA